MGKKLKYIDLDLFSLNGVKVLTELYADQGTSRAATLYGDADGNIYIYWCWLATHGQGPSSEGCKVKSVEEVRAYLMEDVRKDYLPEKKVDRICMKCEKFFEK